ncbi:uncharacterized protein F4822DRAFT_87916 [Hypoxylon trugodes]|uniref:uncharacterized protein n=1 Tax=Hypoxylon trugodes TaxID=326681 RepID=UPI00219E343E|nr:uncharacterized protein F4822DRAFT_87916 [Hypoxylon trugodes]KAI1382958.1 hypothetical protein F4822DRAFT_87916 [Hypoxylon trugodes]
MPMNLNTPRPFSAASPVHPSYLPALHKSGRIERGIATATVAAVGIGYGLAKYKAAKAEQWQKEHHVQQQQMFRSAEAVVAPATVAVPQQNAAVEAVENAYGDRTSLAELEAAVVAYETRRKD